MPSWWNSGRKSKNKVRSQEQQQQQQQHQKQQRVEMRSFNDYSNGPLFRKRSDKPGHGTNRAHYRTTYGGINPSVMRVDSDTDDKSSMQMWDSFLSGGQTLRFKKEKNKIEEKVEKEEHPLLSILQNAGIVDSVSTDSLFQDRSTAFLQENSKAKRFGVHGQFRRGGRPSSNGMRFSSSRGGGGGGQPNYAPGAPQFSSPNYGSQPPSFASPRMTNYNMFQDQGQQQQQQQGEQLNIDSVQPDAFTGAGPSGGNPFGGNMPPPAAPSYEYSQISSGGRGGRPVPPPPPPTLPAMTRGKSPRPTAPSSPPSSSGGSMSSSSSSSNSNLPPMSMGPFSAGTQKTSTKMPEMPAGIDVHFLPRFKETSTSFVHGAAAFKDGMHPTPPLPRTPPHG